MQWRKVWDNRIVKPFITNNLSNGAKKGQAPYKRPYFIQNNTKSYRYFENQQQKENIAISHHISSL